MKTAQAALATFALALALTGTAHVIPAVRPVLTRRPKPKAPETPVYPDLLVAARRVFRMGRLDK